MRDSFASPRSATYSNTPVYPITLTFGALTVTAWVPQAILVGLGVAGVTVWLLRRLGAANNRNSSYSVGALEMLGAQDWVAAS